TLNGDTSSEGVPVQLRLVAEGDVARGSVHSESGPATREWTVTAEGLGWENEPPNILVDPNWGTAASYFSVYYPRAGDEGYAPHVNVFLNYVSPSLQQLIEHPAR